MLNKKNKLQSQLKREFVLSVLTKEEMLVSATVDQLNTYLYIK